MVGHSYINAASFSLYKVSIPILQRSFSSFAFTQIVVSVLKIIQSVGRWQLSLSKVNTNLPICHYGLTEAPISVNRRPVDDSKLRFLLACNTHSLQT